MRRLRVLATTLALLLLAAVMLRQSSPGAAARPSEHVAQPVGPPASAPAPPAAIDPPARDIFSYSGQDDGEPPREPAMGPLRAPLPAPPSLAVPVGPVDTGGPRLVGLMRQGGALKAALSVGGDVLVAAKGERAGGYTVVSIDEDDGVTLRDAAGATLTLPPPPQ